MDTLEPKRSIGQEIGGDYVTGQLFEATYLLFKGFKYRTIKDESTQDTLFIFQDSAGLVEDLLNEFWSMSEERRLLESYRAVKRAAVSNKYVRGYHSLDEQRCDRRLPADKK